MELPPFIFTMDVKSSVNYNLIFEMSLSEAISCDIKIINLCVN